MTLVPFSEQNLWKTCGSVCRRNRPKRMTNARRDPMPLTASLPLRARSFAA
jgi:hypothetical protein